MLHCVEKLDEMKEIMTEDYDLTGGVKQSPLKWAVRLKFLFAPDWNNYLNNKGFYKQRLISLTSDESMVTAETPFHSIQTLCNYACELAD